MTDVEIYHCERSNVSEIYLHGGRVCVDLGNDIDKETAIEIFDCIKNHESLVEENTQLKSQLHDLFEHVSGVSVNEYRKEQMPYLADYIIGQAEADNSCIEKLKADKSELVKALNGVMNIVAVSKGVDGYHCNGDVACWWDFDEVCEVSDLIQKHKETNND